MSASAARVPPAPQLARLAVPACVSVCEWGCFTGSMTEFLTEKHMEPPRRSGHWTGTAAQTNRGRPGESGELSEPTHSFNVTATLSQTARAAAREAPRHRHESSHWDIQRSCSGRRRSAFPFLFCLRWRRDTWRDQCRHINYIQDEHFA